MRLINGQDLVHMETPCVYAVSIRWGCSQFFFVAILPDFSRKRAVVSRGEIFEISQPRQTIYCNSTYYKSITCTKLHEEVDSLNRDPLGTKSLLFFHFEGTHYSSREICYIYFFPMNEFFNETNSPNKGPVCSNKGPVSSCLFH